MNLLGDGQLRAPGSRSMNGLINLSSRGQRPPWPRRKPPSRSLLFPSLLLLTLLVFLCYNYSISKSALTVSPVSVTAPALRCNPGILSSGEKFLLYAPHSGFNNQLSELRNAALIAGILNRTLVVPPVLDHHAVALGSCPKFRILGPTEIRAAVWDHSLELTRSGRYVSMADIVDIASLVSSSLIRMIDFRVFASLFCGLNIENACSSDSIEQTSLLSSLKQCGSFLSGADGNVDKCFYAVEEDCRSTVWIYQKEDEDGKLDLFQPDEQLRKKKKISHVRTRRDVYKVLGPGTKAGSAKVLAFGSLFTSPYKGSQLLIDIAGAPMDQKIHSLSEKLEFIPFVAEIVSAGKEFAEKTIGKPFFCAQLRLLDGQFKNHWKSTFLGLKERTEPLREKGPLPIHIFVMTDLPESNWTGNYLGELAQDSSSYKLHFLKVEDELVARTAKEISVAGHSLRIGTVSYGSGRIEVLRKSCSPKTLPDVLLYIEEVVCSCAALGFVGTAGSTIGESIELMRKYDSCSISSPTSS